MPITWPPCRRLSTSARFFNLALGLVNNADAGVRADKFLLQSNHVPASLLHKLFRLKKFRVVRPPAGVVALTPRSPLEAGETVVTDKETLALLQPEAQRRLLEPSAAVSSPVRLPPLPAWLSSPSAIAHCCESIAVISKPAGVPCQGGSGQKSGSTVAALLPALGATLSRERGGSDSLRLLHRLDKPVSGLLLLGRTLRASRLVAATLAEGKGEGAAIQKSYVGIVAGRLPLTILRGAHNASGTAAGLPIVPSVVSVGGGSLQSVVEFDAPRDSPAAAGTSEALFSLSGTIRAPVLQQGDDGKVTTSQGETRFIAHTITRPPAAAAAAAQNSFTSIGAAGQRAARASTPSQQSTPAIISPCDHDDAVTVLHLSPITGRKHQLRQHTRLLFGGKAGLLGDTKYGGSMQDWGSGSDNGNGSADSKNTAIALHAGRLSIAAGFFSPHQQEAVVARAEVPAYMRRWLRKWLQERDSRLRSQTPLPPPLRYLASPGHAVQLHAATAGNASSDMARAVGGAEQRSGAAGINPTSALLRCLLDLDASADVLFKLQKRKETEP